SLTSRAPPAIHTLPLHDALPIYPENQQRISFFEQLVSRVRQLPGVSEAAAVNFLPMGHGGRTSTTFRVDGRPAPPKGREPFADRSEEHTSELQSHLNLVCRLLLE